MKFLIIFFLASINLVANVCTPLNVGAQGIDNMFAPIVNGIDAVDYGVARIQWTSDASGGTPAIAQQIIYSTSAEWSASAATITNIAITTNIATITANNSFTSTQNILISGLTNTVLNGTWQLISASSTQFTFAITTSDISSTSDSGTANAYIHVLYPFQNTNVTSSTNIQGGILSNIFDGMVYHVTGQSWQGSGWCSSTDETFTTPSKPAIAPLPQLPATPDLTPPVGGGTSWIYGTNCGTTVGTSPTIVTANWLDCFNKTTVNTTTNIADDLSAPPGIYQIYTFTIPNSPFTVPITCSTTTSFCTQSSGSAPANGTKIVLSSLPNSEPSPINPGIPYYVVSSTGVGGTFQLSLTSGGTPITLTSNGSSALYIPYTNWIGQGKIKVHSTASSSLLPPPGTKFGLSNYIQYLPNMVVFQAEDPVVAGGEGMVFGAFSDNYWFENVAWTTDPAVASGTNPLDPIGFRVIFQTNLSQHGITLNQSGILPALPPSRSELMIFDGTDMVIMNSLQYGLDFWQIYTTATTGVSSTSNSISIPAITYNWVVSGGSNVGQKASCNYTGGGVTGIGGSATGSIAAYAIPNGINPAICDVTVVFPTGTTGTPSNLTFTTATTPATPTYTYTSPSLGTGFNIIGHSAIPIVNSSFSTITSGLVTHFANSGEDAQSKSNQNVFQSGGGIEIDGWHRPYFDNNDFRGAGIVGPFVTDAFQTGTPCFGVGFVPCATDDIISDITMTRNSMGAFPCLLYSSSCWNGGDYFWRNTGEFKAGWKSLQEGNIIGPWSSEIGEGECALHEAFSDVFAQFVGRVNSGDWTFTNNTCINMSATGLSTNFSFDSDSSNTAAYPYKNILIGNNLFINNSGYNQGPQPWGSGKTNPNQSGCAYGHLNQWTYQGQNYIYDHNTVFGQGGCLPIFEWISSQLGSEMQFTNSIYNLVGNSDNFLGSFVGTVYEPYGLSGPPIGPNPPCTGQNGLTLFNCLTNYTWGGNVMLATWSDSNPSSLTEYNSSQIASMISTYPSSLWPNANTLAARISQVNWNNPNGYFRLNHNSPYNSGNQITLDGKDAGVDFTKIITHQGWVTNVRSYSTSSTSLTILWEAPDENNCVVDWGTSNFFNGSGSWTRDTTINSNRNQKVVLSVPAHANIFYRISCATFQPTGSLQLP